MCQKLLRPLPAPGHRRIACTCTRVQYSGFNWQHLRVVIAARLVHHRSLCRCPCQLPLCNDLFFLFGDSDSLSRLLSNFSILLFPSFLVTLSFLVFTLFSLSFITLRLCILFLSFWFGTLAGRSLGAVDESTPSSRLQFPWSCANSTLTEKRKSWYWQIKQSCSCSATLSCFAMQAPHSFNSAFFLKHSLSQCPSL